MFTVLPLSFPSTTPRLCRAVVLCKAYVKGSDFYTISNGFYLNKTNSIIPFHNAKYTSNQSSYSQSLSCHLQTKDTLESPPSPRTRLRTTPHSSSHHFPSFPPSRLRACVLTSPPASEPPTPHDVPNHLGNTPIPFRKK